MIEIAVVGINDDRYQTILIFADPKQLDVMMCWFYIIAAIRCAHDRGVDITDAILQAHEIHPIFPQWN